jgi:hypothetical protein
MVRAGSEDIVRRGYEAFVARDAEGLREVLDPDVVWHVPGKSRVAGDYTGIDDVLAYFDSLMELTGGNFRLELQNVLTKNDLVVGLHHTQAQNGGHVYDEDELVVFRLRDGRVIEAWDVFPNLYSFDRLFN